MILEHYAANPVIAISSRQQHNDTDRFRKPHGFWVSVKGEDDWPSWCKSEDYALNRLRVCHRVNLVENANVLIIPDVWTLDAFSDEYRVEGSRPWDSCINWFAVSHQYDGIIIAPYQWSRLLSDHYGWYYGWGCASGCIWNADAVASIEIMEEA